MAVNALDCPICLETITYEEIKYIDCMHVFHIGCIDRWISFHNNCPLCRKKISIDVSTHGDIHNEIYAFGPSGFRILFNEQFIEEPIVIYSNCAADKRNALIDKCRMRIENMIDRIYSPIKMIGDYLVPLDWTNLMNIAN